MPQEKIPLLVIGGPTASGKTRLAAELALRHSGEVVSADSMQIYRGMEIGTAKPTPEETLGVPHRLMGFVEPGQSFSVADYVAQAKETIGDIHSRGRLPVLCGGTGLYIRSLITNTAFTEALIALRRESDALCNGTYHNVVITNHQLVFERRTDSERVLVAINASDSEYTAGSHELNGTFSRILTYPGEFEALASEEAAVEGAAVQDAAVEDAAAADTVTLNGQITMPAYSVQYLKIQ